MAFWVFMFLMCLAIPIGMIGFGTYFHKKAPDRINMVFGYRTTRSMKSKDTWEFAHHYIGRLWRIIGWIMLPVAAILMLFTIGKSVDLIGTVGGILCGVQLVAMIAPIFPTEAALKKKFDEDGRRR